MAKDKMKFHTVTVHNTTFILSEDELLDLYEEVTDILMKE